MPIAAPVNDYPALIAKAEGDVASADAGSQEALAAQAAKQAELEAAAAPRKQELQTQRDTAAADVQKSLTDGPKVTPLPENKAQHIDPKQLNETASMMMTLAGLAGLMTRRPMVNALSNMTAAMKGLQAGDEEQYQRSYKEFSDNYKKATDQNAANVKEYDRIIKSKEMSLTEKDRAIRDYAKQVGDEVTVNQKSFGDRIKHFDTMRKAGDQAVLKYRTLNEQHDARERSLEQRRQHDETIAAIRREKMAAGAGGAGGAEHGLSPLAVKMFADLGMAGIKPPDISGRKEVSSEKIKVANEMAEAYSQSGVLPTQMKVNQDEHAALAKAMSAIQSRVAGIELGSKKIEKDIATIGDYIENGSASFAKAVNKPLNWIRAQGSDTDLAPYRLAVLQVATEYERLMTGGMLSVAQLHRGAQEDAHKILNEDMTVGEINAVLPVMLREIKNQKEAAQESLVELKSQIGSVGQGKAAQEARPQPNDKDRALAKSRPELAAKFKAHFGVDP